MKSNIMKKTIYLSAFAFAVTTSLVGCGDPLLDDLDTNIEVSTGDLSIAENYEQAAGMFLTAQQKMHDVGASNGAHIMPINTSVPTVSTTMPVTWRVPRTSVVTYPLLTAISPAIATARRPVSSTWLMQPSPLCGRQKASVSKR